MTTSINIRIDKSLKDKASDLFKSMGMDLSTATKVFYTQALRCNGFPFELKGEEPNELTYQVIKEANEGKNMNGPYDSIEELMEALNA